MSKVWWGWGELILRHLIWKFTKRRSSSSWIDSAHFQKKSLLRRPGPVSATLTPLNYFVSGRRPEAGPERRRPDFFLLGCFWDKNVKRHLRFFWTIGGKIRETQQGISRILEEANEVRGWDLLFPLFFSGASFFVLCSKRATPVTQTRTQISEKLHLKMHAFLNACFFSSFCRTVFCILQYLW